MSSLTRRQLLSVVVTWGLLGLGFIIVKTGSTQSLGNQQPDPLVAAVRRGGLREAARITRHYVGTERTTGWVKYDLESLTSNSHVIVIGTPLVGSSNLAGSGDRISTEFKVRIDRILKGKLEEKRLLNIVVPGGKVTFEDGTSAEIKTPDLGGIEKHEQYLFFLKPSDEDPKVFQLTGGGQGLFELSSVNSRVKPLGDKRDVVQKYKDRKVGDFVEEIETAVRKYPETLPGGN